MPTDTIRVLLVEDDEDDYVITRDYLEQTSGPRYAIEWVRTFEEAIAAINLGEHDVYIVDYHIGSHSGLEVLNAAQTALATTPAIMLTGETSSGTDVAALRSGASDYLVKGRFDGSDIERAIRYARERKRIAIALRRSEMSYRALVEHATYGIYRSDADGRFLTVNPALVALLGYDEPKQLLALHPPRDVYVKPEDHEAVASLLLDSPGVEEAEVLWKRRDESQITVRLSGRAVLGDDGVESWEFIAHDVTQQHALETQLRQSQKMEALGQLTGGIAHEINNVLSVIVADTGLALNALPADRDDLKVDLREVLAAARRGGALIKKLLGFCRRERLELVAVDLGSLVTEVAHMLSRVMPTNIAFDVSVAEKLTAVSADRTAVQQMLLNVCTNARDAMPSGGRIQIVVEPVALDKAFCDAHQGAQPGNYVRVTVQDPGLGMDSETLECVFEPFYTTKPQGVGTGLGMAMVYGLVKQHRGYIDVQSTPGVGTTVSVYFACSRRTAAAPSGPSTTHDLRGGTETILLVEDQLPLRRAGKRILEHYGYTVLPAEDGAAALDTFKKHAGRIDLVITDVVMPNLGGQRLFEELRQEANAPRFLFTSGYSASDLRAGDLLDPDLPLLDKPWTIDEFVKRVRAILDEPATAATSGS